ncbi:MFS transporter [Collinsella sp. zg1085]|uniref:MFS transporter n=1 Tax=Collinsella sp. zg1085 TaxID=2844380 RepID=UPI001C0DB792|nr:MFS transporter [Collinsella sp. zg1085]QWT17160.1 MFS transporter [Collinsella sp. zg1085]
MSTEKKRYLVGIYAAAMTIMGMLVPVPILAQIAASFPDENIALVQMVIGVIPLFMALSAMLVSSLLAQHISKKITTIAGHCLLTVAGLSVYYFLHSSLVELLVGSALIGVGIGALQNSSDALIADYFEGKQRGFVMGIYSTFVALGGVLWVGLSGFLGAESWTQSYMAFYAMIPFIIIEIICLPKGELEPQRQVNVFANMPREVRIITLVSFVFILVFQLFSSNVSLIIASRGLGGVAEAAAATQVVSLAGIPAGLVVGSLFSRFKNLAMPLTWTVSLLGLVLTLLAPGFALVCVAGFLLSLGKETFLPLEGNFAAGNSAKEGRAFNLAIGMAGINAGMALSPLFFEAVSTPFGSSIESKFIIGIVICIAVIVFGCMHYRKLTPAQLAEMERLEQETGKH